MTAKRAKLKEARSFPSQQIVIESLDFVVVVDSFLYSSSSSSHGKYHKKFCPDETISNYVILAKVYTEVWLWLSQSRNKKNCRAVATVQKGAKWFLRSDHIGNRRFLLLLTVLAISTTAKKLNNGAIQLFSEGKWKFMPFLLVMMTADTIWLNQKARWIFKFCEKRPLSRPFFMSERPPYVPNVLAVFWKLWHLAAQVLKCPHLSLGETRRW